MAEIIKGCGVDIIEIDRIATALQKDGFRHRIYTQTEKEYLEPKQPQSWAAGFAAKEAVMKALGIGWQKGIKFTDIEVQHDQYGKPSIALFGVALDIAGRNNITQVHISLSHNNQVAVAYAIAVGEG